MLLKHATDERLVVIVCRPITWFHEKSTNIRNNLNQILKMIGYELFPNVNVSHGTQDSL